MPLLNSHDGGLQDLDASGIFHSMLLDNYRSNLLHVQGMDRYYILKQRSSKIILSRRRGFLAKFLMILLFQILAIHLAKHNTYV